MDEKWGRDSALIFALIFIFLGYRGYVWGLGLAALIIVLLVLYPAALYPLGYLWHKIAEVLAGVMNAGIFSLVFFLVVTPIGYLHRIISGDMRSLKVRRERTSAFIERGFAVDKKSLLKPY